MDLSGKIVQFNPDDLISIGDNPGHSDHSLKVWIESLGHSKEAPSN